MLHPILGGNKLRKLDALLPCLQSAAITDVVTCGGIQSAHTAAIAAACSEVGIEAHLLVRGERPDVPVGYHLLARMFGKVTYVPRSEYRDRECMLTNYTQKLKSSSPEAKIRVVPEGAAEPLALVGLVRLIDWLASSDVVPGSVPCSLVVDSGTGTTAVGADTLTARIDRFNLHSSIYPLIVCSPGLALGIYLRQLPWKVVAVMLAGKESSYRQEAARLAEAFLETSWEGSIPLDSGEVEGKWLAEIRSSTAGTASEGLLPLHWVDRARPRRFGRVFPAEICACEMIAKRTGVLLDPIYSLAAWEVAEKLADGWTPPGLLAGAVSSRVVMLHCGGALGLHGLAQRFPDSF